MRTKKQYPTKVGVCNECGDDIIARNSWFDKPNRRFCSTSCRTSYWNRRAVFSDERRKKISETAKKTFTGRKFTEEHRRKIAIANIGEKSHRWRGGLTSINARLRNSVDYAIWRDRVYQRDNYTCQVCKKPGDGDLNAHHIKPWCKYPELRFEVSNGQTLCEECHKKTENFGVKAAYAA